MNILDIAIAKKLAGGGGGSGTDNYNDLSNLPKINDTTLSGNKSSSALGLQSEINSDSKLASDLVDDTNQDNKFVTSTEKNTWNGKQNAIDADHKLSSDLVDDANKTNKFVTSTEKNTWNAKQNAIDSDHKLSSSLVSFSTAEAAALASGIDSSKVEQISTNQTNILSVQDATEELVDKGAKNIFDAQTPDYTRDTSIVPLSNGGITISCTNAIWTQYRKSVSVIPNKAYRFMIYADSISEGLQNFDVRVTTNETTPVGLGVIENIHVTGAYHIDLTPTTDSINVLLFLNNTETAKTQSANIRVLLCSMAEWKSSPTYQPYALPNYDLTQLQAEDRAALVKCVDEGAKNLFCPTLTSTTIAGVTCTKNSDGSYSVYGTHTGYGLAIALGTFTGVSGKQYMVSSGMSEPSTGQSYALEIVPYFYVGAVPVLYTADGTTCTVELAINDINATESNPIIFKPMICTIDDWKISQQFVPHALPNTDLTRMMTPFFTVPINHNMIYRGQNLGDTLTEAQHTALSSGNFTDLYLGDYWTKTVTIPAGTYTGGDGESVDIPAQTDITLKAVIADFDTFYAGYASGYAGINTHHAAVIVTGFDNVVWNKTNSTAGGYVNSLIHKWLVGSALPQIETWFGSAKVLSHQKLLTNAITGDAASGWAWSSQKISLLSENQMYGSKVWGNSKVSNGGFEPGEAFKHLNVFNHIDVNLLFGNKNIWLRDIASAVGAVILSSSGSASYSDASYATVAPAALILLS